MDGGQFLHLTILPIREKESKNETEGKEKKKRKLKEDERKTEEEEGKTEEREGKTEEQEGKTDGGKRYEAKRLVEETSKLFVNRKSFSLIFEPSKS